jgi:hypothetical protein
MPATHPARDPSAGDHGLSRADYDKISGRIMSDGKFTDACINALKEKAKDPASLQMTGDWTATDSAFRLSTKNRITIVRPIRMRNRFGGLQNATLICYYDYSAAAQDFSFSGLDAE